MKATTIVNSIQQKHEQQVTTRKEGSFQTRLYQYIAKIEKNSLEVSNFNLNEEINLKTNITIV